MIGIEIFRIEELSANGPATLRVSLMEPSLCAGFQSPADDFTENALEMLRWLVPNPPASFLWRISGESMALPAMDRAAGIEGEGYRRLADRQIRPSAPARAGSQRG